MSQTPQLKLFSLFCKKRVDGCTYTGVRSPAALIVQLKKAKMSTLEKIHPFESAGLGVGPFVFVCSVEIGDPEDGASFMNSSRIQSEQAKKFKVGFGTCHHCGRGIMHNAVRQ